MNRIILNNLGFIGILLIIVLVIITIICANFYWYKKKEDMHEQFTLTSEEMSRYLEYSKSLDYEPGPIFPDEDLHDVTLEGIELMHKEGFSICESIRDSNL